jgi:release factor glutamine methyltransferase
VTNPPYIPTGVIQGLDKEVLEEPRVALDGGADGLSVARRIIAEAPAALKDSGALFMELGESQGAAALALLSPAVWAVRRLEKDFSGKARFVAAVKKR